MTLPFNFHRFQHSLRVIRAVSIVTFREIIRDKVLYNLFLCSFFLLGVAWLASKLTVIKPERVILDFGLTAISISSIAIAVLNGSSLLGRELEKRTIQVALSRPISRSGFVLGKFTGLAGVLALNWFLISGAYLLMLGLISEEGRALVTGTLGIALVFVLVQSILLASFSILFSTFSTTSLSIMLSIGVYLIGCNISELQLASVKLQSSAGRGLMYSVVCFLPNFEYFNLGTLVVYGLPISAKFVGLSLAYGSVMMAITLGLAGLLMQVREV